MDAAPPAEMAHQLDHVVELSRRENLSVGVIPWGTAQIELPLHSWSLYDDRLVVIGMSGFALDLADPDDVGRYVELTDQVSATAEWDDAARERLTEAAERYRGME